MNYMLVGSFANLGATGSVKDTGLDLTYPVLRSPAQNANLAFTQAHKILDNYANAVPTSTYTMDTSVVNYAVSSADEWSGGGFNSASLGISTGNVNLNGSVNQPSDAQTYRTEGHYWHSNINLSREQFLTEQTSGFISYGVQNANKNLDSSEKLYLGGASGVRAYPTNEGGGSAGQIASLEIRNKLDDRWTVTGFYDYGKIVQYQNNSDINGNSLSLNSPNTYELQGYGISLEWKSAEGIDLRATIAKRVAKNPAANITTGMDSDGTYKNPHIWVVANVPF
jgi:hemolysin activation/secretion protein